MQDCRMCGETKEYSDFHKLTRSKSGYDSLCKECDRARHVEYFNKNKDKVRESKIRWLRNNRPNAIYNGIRDRSRKKRFDVCTMEEFIIWYNSQEKVCVYCDIKESQIKLAWGEYRPNLEIDRTDNNKGYTLDNIALACHTCNVVKLNIFNFNEMREIGQNYIKSKYKSLLELVNVS